jgi:DNA-3-methyladenine glycosylase II
MVFSELAQNACHHITKLGSKKLSEFVELTGPIEIPTRYGDDYLLGLARIVVGQQLSNQAARSIWERLSSRYPDRSALLDALRSPETRYTGLSASKRRTLSELMHLGDKWIGDVSNESESQRQQALLAIWGLGPWSVAMWELFVLQNPDQWSDRDLILNRVSEIFSQDAKVERRDFIMKGAPFRSYLALYCWRFNDAQRAAK